MLVIMTSKPIEVAGVAYTSDFTDLKNPFRPTAEQSILEFISPQAREDESDEVPESLYHEFNLNDGIAIVYSAVRAKRLASIAGHGLLRRKNSIGTMAPIAHEAMFFLERPKSLAQFDRTRSVFARPWAPDPEHATYYDSARGQFTYLELAVTAQEVLIADQQIWDDAAATYTQGEGDYLSREELAETIRPLARRYWEATMSLADYLAEPAASVMVPEVIIPFDITPDRLRIFVPGAEDTK
jgi:hypothetical protein